MLDLACFASFKKQNYLTLPRNSTCDAPSEPGALSHASQRPRCPPIEREKMTIENLTQVTYVKMLEIRNVH